MLDHANWFLLNNLYDLKLLLLAHKCFYQTDPETTVADRNKTESQNSKQNHKTQNRITKPKNGFAKPKTKSQKSKQNHKTQNTITKP